MSNKSNKNQRKQSRNDNSSNGSSGQGDKSSKSRRRKGPRKKKVDPRAYWGDAEALAEVTGKKATITSNPSAVVQSLGRPPLSGQQNAAELYFAAVYERAVGLASALAAAGDLIETDDPADSGPLVAPGPDDGGDADTNGAGASDGQG